LISSTGYHPGRLGKHQVKLKEYQLQQDPAATLPQILKNSAMEGYESDFLEILGHSDVTLQIWFDDLAIRIENRKAGMWATIIADGSHNSDLPMAIYSSLKPINPKSDLFSDENCDALTGIWGAVGFP
jgi:hypothetical protein